MTSGLALPSHQAIGSYCHGGHEELAQSQGNAMAYDVPPSNWLRSGGAHAIHGNKAEGPLVSSPAAIKPACARTSRRLLLARAVLQPARVSKSANLADFGAGYFPVDPMELEGRFSVELGAP